MPRCFKVPGEELWQIYNLHFESLLDKLDECDPAQPNQSEEIRRIYFYLVQRRGWIYRTMRVWKLYEKPDVWVL